jgi:hypothetical protein
MTAPLPEISFKNLIAVRDRANTLFKKHRVIFVRTAIPFQGEPNIAINEPNGQYHPIQELNIEKTDIPALYERITNSTKFQEVVNRIIRVDTLKLLQQIQLLLKEHQGSMPKDVSENIQIISKFVIQFQRRIQMTLKTSFEECNDVKAVQEIAREVLTKAYKNGLISYVMPALLEGLKTTPAYYKWVTGYFNDFLEQYGIYTQMYHLNQEIDYDVLHPETAQITDNEGLHGKIADLLMLPYFFNDERYKGQALLCEGQCIGWRFEK